MLQIATQYDEKIWFECIIHGLIKSIISSIIGEVKLLEQHEIDKVCEATCIWYGV